MTKFQFDGWASLQRVRECLPLPNRPNPPNREEHSKNGLGRLGRLGRVGTSKLSCSGDPEALADALNQFEERAAIREYDGGQSRAEAEAAAMNEAAETFGFEVPEIREAIRAKTSLVNFDE